MTLDEFESELRRLIGKPTRLRPFVCDGSPLDCPVMLVGLNPASKMRKDFWDFWRPGIGFDKAAWFECYLRERAAEPLAPGRTRRHAISPTRRNIEAFGDGAGAVKVLETNIFAVPSESPDTLEGEDADTRPFEWLLRAVKPRVIVAHGKPAQKTIKHLAPQTMTISSKHLRLLSREAAVELGQRAARAL